MEEVAIGLKSTLPTTEPLGTLEHAVLRAEEEGAREEERVETREEEEELAEKGALQEAENRSEEEEEIEPGNIDKIVQEISIKVEEIASGCAETHEKYKILPSIMIILPSILSAFIALFLSLHFWSISVLGGIVSCVVLLLSAVWVIFICRSIKKNKHAKGVFSVLAIAGILLSILPILIIGAFGSLPDFFADVRQLALVCVYSFGAMSALLLGLLEGISRSFDHIWARRVLRVLFYTLALAGVLGAIFQHNTLITPSRGSWQGAYVVFLSALVFFAGALFESRDYHRKERISPGWQKFSILLFFLYLLLMLCLLAGYVLVGALREDLLKNTQ